MKAVVEEITPVPVVSGFPQVDLGGDGDRHANLKGVIPPNRDRFKAGRVASDIELALQPRKRSVDFRSLLVSRWFALTGC